MTDQTRATLTIAIPTYNRADQLDRQLGWVAKVVEDHGQVVTVLVSDNCSTDHTAAVADRWVARLGGDGIVVHRHDRNRGAVGNIASCIRRAETSHVWVVSDDDWIDDDAAEEVLSTLVTAPDVALVALNFFSRVPGASAPLLQRCFEVQDDGIRPDGKAVFVRCVAPRAGVRWGGMALRTALVYRTDLARAAIDAWPAGLANDMVQLYWSGYCASHGPARVTVRTHVECRAGEHDFTANPTSYLKLRSADTCEAFVRLAEEGVAPALMLRKVVERPLAFAPLVPPCARQDPAFAGAMVARWAWALWGAVAALGRDARRHVGAGPPAGVGRLAAARGFLAQARRDWALGGGPWSRR